MDTPTIIASLAVIITIMILLTLGIAISIIIDWIDLSSCAVAKRTDELDEGTGTEAISDARIRELLTRERYERECV